MWAFILVCVIGFLLIDLYPHIFESLKRDSDYWKNRKEIK